jgi:hypothetical protein
MTDETVSSIPPVPVIPPPEPAVPIGIGGWMIIPILGFIATIVFTVYNLPDYKDFFVGFFGQAKNLEMPLIVKSLVIASFAGTFIGTFVAIAALIVVFRKLRIAPKVVTVYFVLMVVFSLIDIWEDGVISKAIQEERDSSLLIDALRAVIFAVIWIPYFHMSRRAKNTFVN